MTLGWNDLNAGNLGAGVNRASITQLVALTDTATRMTSPTCICRRSTPWPDPSGAPFSNGVVSICFDGGERAPRHGPFSTRRVATVCADRQLRHRRA
jgi:hypothetical protein